MLGALIVGIAFAQASASADPCNKTLAPSPVAGRDGYSRRAEGERCEGVYISTVSAKPIELVSLTRGRLSYDAIKPTVLLITLDAPPPDGVAHVLAVGVPEGLYYQMDADVEGNHAVRWPVNDVLARLKIEPNKVGVLAYRKNPSSETIYLPVDVVPGDVKPAHGEPIVALVRAINLTDLRYRFIRRTQNAPPGYTSASVNDDRAEIPLSEDSGPISGTLEVRGIDAATGMSRSQTFVIGN
jgi:hypothetical protein